MVRLAVFAALAAVLYVAPQWIDFGQCDRRCRMTLGTGILDGSLSGSRKFGSDMCECKSSTDSSIIKGEVPRLYPSIPLGYPYINKPPVMKTALIPGPANQQQEKQDMKHLSELQELKLARDERVCGADGKTYASAVEAKTAGTKVLHCGRCGRCSTVHDVGRFRAMATSISQVTSVCIVARMLLPLLMPVALPEPYIELGRWVDLQCMQSRAGLSPPCAECWVEDHGCLITHCFNSCIMSKGPWKNMMIGSKKWEGHSKKSTGGSAQCVACMERRCSKPYVDECGANRRTAGIQTDIVRDESEMCSAAEVIAP